MTADHSDSAPVLVLDEVKEIIENGIPADFIDGKKVLVLTPDTTRTCPLPMMVQALDETISARCAVLDFMVALGTHTPLADKAILKLYGLTDTGHRQNLKGSRFLNHQWDQPDTFQRIGFFSDEEIAEISGGLLRVRVPIDINKHIFEYDLILVLGPVFPHEVAGFSGGAKYFFPGISGGEFLHLFHWLGAIITCMKTIGHKETPIRKMIDRAMEKISIPSLGLSMVVDEDEQLRGLFAGSLQETWSQAVDLSARYHIVYKP